ncbi:MAG TPA: hypothetical protein VEL74_10385 [Thermoanaerobaculia bacterium]|nr:hypothetical protein [Thermoanaerobaculia bacterium]
MSWNRREFLGRSLMGVGLACLPLAGVGAAPAAASPAPALPDFGATAAPGMERWLLDTGRSHIDAPIYDLVSSRIR